VDPIASVTFRDLEAGCEGYAGTRAGDGIVGLALSLESDGDIEVVVTSAQARDIAAALEAAAKRADGAVAGA
jgi:hypothetical protein